MPTGTHDPRLIPASSYESLHEGDYGTSNIKRDPRLNPVYDFINTYIGPRELSGYPNNHFKTMAQKIKEFKQHDLITDKTKTSMLTEINNLKFKLFLLKNSINKGILGASMCAALLGGGLFLWIRISVSFFEACRSKTPYPSWFECDKPKNFPFDNAWGIIGGSVIGLPLMFGVISCCFERVTAIIKACLDIDNAPKVLNKSHERLIAILDKASSEALQSPQRLESAINNYNNVFAA